MNRRKITTLALTLALPLGIASAPQATAEDTAGSLSSLAETAPAATAPNKESGDSEQQTKVTQKALFDATNAYRAKHGLPQLKANEGVNDVAQKWAERMAATGDFKHNPEFSEQYPDGWRAAAENIAASNDPAVSAQDFIEMWHNSAGHRKNMQNATYNTLGIGVATAPDGTTYAVQNFGAY